MYLYDNLIPLRTQQKKKGRGNRKGQFNKMSKKKKKGFVLKKDANFPIRQAI